MTDWIDDPILKLRLRLQADGETLTGDVELHPGGGIGKHFHPKQEERWTVLEGKVRFRLSRHKQIAPIGTELVVAAGVKHSLKNVGDANARLRFTADPALDLEPFLREAVAMNRAGKVTGFGMPTSFGALLDGAMMIDRYKDTCVLMSPPPFLQPILISPLARLGRRRRSRG